MAKKKVSELEAVVPEELLPFDLLYVSQSDGEGGYVSKKTTVEQFIDDVNLISDIWVDTSGDLMTGTLQFLEDDAETTPMNITPLGDGSINIASADLDTIIYMHLSTADSVEQPTTGGVTTGRLRWAQPIDEADDNDVIGSSKASGLIKVNVPEAGQVYIRKNNGAPGFDFFLGSWFEVWSDNGSVELLPETGAVTLIIPAGKLAKTRDAYSKIKAVLVNAVVTVEGGPPSYESEHWLISGDLADAP